jgi:hypothetical protein
MTAPREDVLTNGIRIGGKDGGCRRRNYRCQPRANRFRSPSSRSTPRHRRIPAGKRIGRFSCLIKHSSMLMLRCGKIAAFLQGLDP